VSWANLRDRTRSPRVRHCHLAWSDMWRVDLLENDGSTARASLPPQFFADAVEVGRDSFAAVGRLAAAVSRKHLELRATGRGTLSCTQFGSNKSFVQRRGMAAKAPHTKGETVELSAGDTVWLSLTRPRTRTRMLALSRPCP